VTSNAGHSHHAVLERLSERLEDGAGKLGQLVEQQNAPVRECAGMSLDGPDGPSDPSLPSG
jgi:hypothetical protein